MKLRIHRFRIVSVALAFTLLLGAWTSSPVGMRAASADPVLVGAGDIAECGSQGAEETAQLIEGIPGTVFTLGDNVYPNGSLKKFQNCYDPSWGRFKDRTEPVIGNHDSPNGSAGYFGYFGARATPLDPYCTERCNGYYSYDLGAWHIVVLNSELDISAGSTEETWLRADLAAHPAACALAMWHEPLFSSGLHGNNPRVKPLWDTLYQYGADVVLNGHDHTYQRFAPQSPLGQADPNGIREFVAGTGGAALYEFTRDQPNSEVRDDSTFGVLKLTLHASSYDWQFIPVAGGIFTDSGTANCTSGQSVRQTIGTAVAAVPTFVATVAPQAGLSPQGVPAPVVPDISSPLSLLGRLIAWLRHLLAGR